MAMDLEQRYLKRYDDSVKILEKVVENRERAILDSLELADLSNRLFITPTFIWERFFKLGLNSELFWEKGLETFEFTTKWTFAFNRFYALSEACDPSNRRVTDISLNGTIYKGDASFYHVFGHLGEQAEQSLQRLPNLAADIVLSALSTDDVQLARYNLKFIKGRGRFPFDDLIDGGVQYRLPTILEAAQATLTYPKDVQYPIAGLRINPLSS